MIPYKQIIFVYRYNRFTSSKNINTIHQNKLLTYETTYSGKLFYQWSSYFTYYKKYKRVLAALGLNENHRPHDARKTFITRAKKKGLDEFAIKRLVGHTISDITERVYTERDISWLREEINKL